MTKPGFTIELACCESVLLNEISWPETKQKSLAITYAMSICSSESRTIDWAKVNAAIEKRWSKSAVTRVKEMAWKLIEAKRSKGEIHA
jgi:hypothetical protein